MRETQDNSRRSEIHEHFLFLFLLFCYYRLQYFFSFVFWRRWLKKRSVFHEILPNLAEQKGIARRDWGSPGDWDARGAQTWPTLTALGLRPSQVNQSVSSVALHVIAKFSFFVQLLFCFFSRRDQSRAAPSEVNSSFFFPAACSECVRIARTPNIRHKIV